MTLDVQEKNGTITFPVLVVPCSSRDGVGPIIGDRLKVFLTTPPIDGKANKLLIVLFAKIFGIPRKNIEIVLGHKKKRKIIRIKGMSSGIFLDQIQGIL